MARRVAMAVGLAALFALVPRATGCTGGEASGPADCVAAGGQCVLGGGGPNCAKVGPQDCNPDRNPGGAACCLETRLGCQLGGACSNTQPCMGGIAGCQSNCQCLDGIWQAPCPTNLPETASACGPEGAECGYVTSTNSCGAANCDCRSGTWSCGPSCAIATDDAGADASGFPRRLRRRGAIAELRRRGYPGRELQSNLPGGLRLRCRGRGRVVLAVLARLPGLTAPSPTVP